MIRTFPSDPMSKVCRECNQDQPLGEFYKHAQMADGHLNKCKSCTRARVLRHRSANLDRIRSYDRSRGSRISSEYLRTWRATNPEKYRAHNAVNNAIRDGHLAKPEHCEVCESDLGLHAHHDDYSQPLKVRWLCAMHHHQLHVKIGDTDARP